MRFVTKTDFCSLGYHRGSSCPKVPLYSPVVAYATRIVHVSSTKSGRRNQVQCYKCDGEPILHSLLTLRKTVTPRPYPCPLPTYPWPQISRLFLILRVLRIKSLRGSFVEQAPVLPNLASYDRLRRGVVFEGLFFRRRGGERLANRRDLSDADGKVNHRMLRISQPYY